jgi:Flp pilus assembly protein TadD
MFQRALGLDPAQEGWLEQFAEVELRLGKITEAEQAISQAILIRPDGEGFHLMLGAVLLAKGDRRGAEQAFAEEVRLYPQDATARNALQQLSQEQPKQVSSASQAQ